MREQRWYIQCRATITLLEDKCHHFSKIHKIICHPHLWGWDMKCFFLVSSNSYPCSTLCQNRYDLYRIVPFDILNYLQNSQHQIRGVLRSSNCGSVFTINNDCSCMQYHVILNKLTTVPMGVWDIQGSILFLHWQKGEKNVTSYL